MRSLRLPRALGKLVSPNEPSLWKGDYIGLPSTRTGTHDLPPGGPRLTLARYNGPSHQHGEIRYKPHIHRATETAILAGRKPEHAAEETTRYETLEGALACLIEDFRLSGIRANPDHPSLFNGN